MQQTKHKKFDIKRSLSYIKFDTNYENRKKKQK